MRVVTKPQILLVDDNFDNLLLLESILNKLEVNIIKASSGEEALTKIDGMELALALVDIKMPKMNGIEFVKLLHEDKNRQKFPIIFITAYYNGEFQFIDGYKVGAVDYLFKPIDPTILLNKTRVFLEMDKQKKQLFDSKNKLQAIHENIPGGILVIDRDYIIQDVNGGTCRITGYQKEELIGQLCDKVCPKGSASKECPVWVNNQIEFKEMDTIIKCADGQNRPILKNAKQICIEEELYVLEIFQDISELKQAESALVESEKKYRTLVEQSLQGIFVISDSRIVFANESLARMTGYTREELISLSKEQISLVIGVRLMDYLNTGETDSLTVKGKTTISPSTEYQGIRKDGSGGWFQISANPILYGGKAAIQGTVIDITEKKFAEQALVESENKYRGLLDASPEGILIIDLKGYIEEVSSITPEIFGTKNKNDLLDKHFLRFIHKESHKKVREIIERTMSEGLEQDIELILTKANQKQFIGEVSTTLIQESNGMPRFFMAIIRDISQRKEIAKQLIHTERLAGLGEMATGIAHEINQPLNTISMSLDNMLLEISKIENEKSNYLEKKVNKIFENIYRISKIIDHIRAFSRDQDDYISTAFDINESIKNALSMISVQCKHRGIDLTIDLSTNIPQILGNTYRFEQVVLNLIINARDAVEEKEKYVRFNKEIKIRTFFEDHNLCLAIVDNGVGIKEEDIDNVMLPFYSTKEVGKGTGMGLAISFGIIKEMKGKISIQSEILKGTYILITLPSTEIDEDKIIYTPGN